MEEVVVTAGRVKEKKKEVTSNVTIINEEEIKISTATDLGDLLAEKGVGHIHKYPGASTSIGIRAFRTDTTGVDLAGKVLVLIDGRRSGTGNASKIMTKNIERIEIIRGPASVQYGSAAMGGVVNVITKQGRGKPTAFVEGVLGSYEYQESSVGFSGKYKNAIKRFIGGGLLIDADNYLYAANAVEDKIFKYNLSGKLIKCFQSKYVPFKSLDKDLLPGTEGIFEFFKRAKGRIPNTLLNRIGFISGKYIYAEYIGRKGKYIEVFSKEGDVVNKKSIRVPDGFLITGSYRKYIYFRPFVNHDEKPDEIRNPVLLKYEFTGRLKNR